MSRHVKQQPALRKHKKNTIRTITILLIIFLLLIGGGSYLYYRSQVILNNPGDLFEEASLPATAEKSDASTTNEAPDKSPAPKKSKSESDREQGVVNILLLGIDRTPNGGTSSGTMPHADAIMVIAINFDENSVTLVSLPRDAFVNMPTVQGFYKLNGMFNVGGGYDAQNGAGFLMMCRAAEWMLGGISIDYYYSVDFQAVVDLVDAIGGVDYDMDMSYHGENGRYYAKGLLHLDGQGVLDYLRARKNATVDADDRGRVNRQKDMMVAIFKQIKQSNLLDAMPKVIFSMKDKLFTNTSMEQTLALANFARNVNSDSIRMYSLYGDYKEGPIAWNWTFVDPDNRISVIQEVWGVTVSPLECTSYDFMEWLKDSGFLALKYLSTAEQVGNYAMQLETLSAEQSNAYSAYSDAYYALKNAYNTAAHSLSKEDTQTLVSAQQILKEKTEELANLIAYDQELQWYVRSPWTSDAGINQVYVDFR